MNCFFKISLSDPNIQLWLQSTALESHILKDRIGRRTQTKKVCKKGTQTEFYQNDLRLANKNAKMKAKYLSPLSGASGRAGLG